MKADLEKTAAALGMDLETYCDYLLQRVSALQLELEKSKAIHSEIAEISTRKALDLKVILNNPNFDKPIKEISK